MTTRFTLSVSQQLPGTSRGIAVAFLLLLAVISIYPGIAVAQVQGIRVVGVDRADENEQVHFTAHIAGLPAPSSGQSIRPTTGPALYQQPYELLWNFGDGSPEISSGERPSVSHIFGQQGDYVITVKMRNRARGVLGEHSHRISIRNVAPRIVDGIATIELTGAPRTLELSSRVIDTPQDTLTYKWSFGDGAVEEGIDMWRTNHRWSKDGRYQVILRVNDGDGGETSSSTWVTVGGTEKGPVSAANEPADQPKSLATTSFVANVSGGINTTFNGHIEPMTGIYLISTRPGVCRFMMTAWDPTQLANITLIADMPNLQPGGVRYRFDNPDLYLSFYDTPEEYGAERYLLTAGGKMGTALSSLSRLTALLDGTPTEITEGLGVSPNSAPGHAPDSRKMAATAPFGGAGYSFSGGSLEIAVTTHDRAEGDFNATLSDNRRFYLPLAKDEPPLRSPVTFRGKFTLNLQAARGQGMVRYQDCTTDSFAITSTWPEDDEQHRALSTTPKVSFDSPYDADTLNEATFKVGYFDTAHEFVPVAGRIVRNDKDATFVPLDPLLDGVRYEARVTTGTQGVHGLNGEALEDPDALGYHAWTFFTRIGFDSARPENQLACHVFQTVRDAPLVNDKPTVARIYADWSPHLHVSESDQITQFDTRARLGERGASLGLATDHTFLRPDLRNDVLIKNAKHTANVFGWKPRGREGPQITAALEVQTTPGHWEAVYQTRCPAQYWNRAPLFRIDYYTFEGLPEPDSSTKTDAQRKVEVDAAQHGIYQLGEQYALQLFPLQSIRGRSRGTIRVGWSGRWDIYKGQKEGFKSSEMFNHLIGAAAVAYAKLYSFNTDFVLIFFHSDHHSGGRNVKDVFGHGAGVAYMSIDDKPTMSAIYGAAWVHELGHAFGLKHIPDIGDSKAQQDKWADLAATARKSTRCPDSNCIVYDGIEGFRIASSGRRGWNKSSTEGNAESNNLAPLMLPAGMGIPHQFIATHHYLQVQKGIDQYLAETNGPRQNLYHTASIGSSGWMLASSSARVADKHVSIGGIIDQSDEILFLGPLTGTPENQDEPTDGGHTIALLDAAGGLLSSSRFAVPPVADDRPLRSFSASTPWAKNAASLVILRGTTVLARRDRTATPPNIEIQPLRYAGDSQITLSWSANDADGDALMATVLYSPNGLDEWSTKALWLKESSLTVDASTLEPGPKPTFRIMVSDGFDEVSGQVPVEVKSGLRVLSALPSAEIAADPRDDIVLMLNSGLTAASVSTARVTLREGDQPAVMAEVRYEERSRLVRVLTDTSLKPGTRYRATLDGRLEDTYGNRLATPYTWSFVTADDPE